MAMVAKHKFADSQITTSVSGPFLGEYCWTYISRECPMSFSAKRAQGDERTDVHSTTYSALTATWEERLQRTLPAFAKPSGLMSRKTRRETRMQKRLLGLGGAIMSACRGRVCRRSNCYAIVRYAPCCIWPALVRKLINTQGFVCRFDCVDGVVPE